MVELDKKKEIIEHLKREVKQHGTEAGIRACEALIEKDRECDIAYIERARFLVELGRFKEALEAYNRCFEVWPESPGIYHLRGRFYYALGRDELAVKDFTAIIEMKDQYYRQIALFRRALAFMALGRKDLALADIETLPEDLVDLVERPPKTHKFLIPGDVRLMASGEMPLPVTVTGIEI